MNEVTQAVHEIIGNHLGVPVVDIKDDSYLQEDLNADQLALADIVVTLEEKFSIKIPQEEIIKFNKVGDIVTFVTDNLNEL